MPQSPILDYLESLRARSGAFRGEGRRLHAGTRARRARPVRICIATQDGFVYEVGDSRQPFTIQSISKPLTYGLALEENGEDAVLAQNRRRAVGRRVQCDQPAAPTGARSIR